MEAKMTEKGRELLCKAHAGEGTLSKIKYIALGSGGCAEESPNAVTGKETALKTELVKKEVESHQYIKDPDGSGIRMRYTATLGKDEQANAVISEAGLIDEQENLVAYITFLKKGKDKGMELVFNIDEIF